jgi:DNA-directed RNA polymerase specialized sigma24 family protein
MIELGEAPTRVAAHPTGTRDRLDQVISRIAAGDRAAFRALYAFMAMRVWHTVNISPLGCANASAVARSTFVEVWHSANAAALYDARDWIAMITHRRVNDRLRIIGATGRTGAPLAWAGRATNSPTKPPTVTEYDTHVDGELTALLGTGPATVRISRGVFVRINDLDQALAAIAATTGVARDHRGPAGRAAILHSTIA